MISKSDLIDFYTKCEEENILDLDSAFNIKKAEQIASLLNIDWGENIQNFFVNAKNATLKAREEEEVEKAQKYDNEDYITLTQFSDLYGQDKIIKMTSVQFQKKDEEAEKEYKELWDRAAATRKMADDVLQLNALTAQKEKDWATAGGIASGIAGGAAGLATALDVQRQNAEIRAQNAANRDTAEWSYGALIGEADDLDREARRVHKKILLNKIEWDKQIDSLRLKVVGDEDDDEVFKSININSFNYSITAIGSVRITCTVSNSKTCTIFGNKPAFVDGTLLAKIFQDNKLIGVADLVLPITGLKDKAVTLQGISLCKANKNQPCHIVIMPKNLWKMEA